MNILIHTVRISNFRSLKNVEVKLGSLTVLVGANNSGKTTFLKAINLALGIERRFVCKEDLHISKEDLADEDKKIRIDIRILPTDEKGQRISDFGDLWRDVEFGDLINVDKENKQYVAFRTQIEYSQLKNDYEIKKYKINDWKEDSADWEKEEYEDLLKSSFPTIPLFLIEAQRDILSDLKDRSSYLGKLISKIKIDTEKIEQLEEKIKELNEEIVGSSDVLSYLKEKLMELSSTIQADNTGGVEITPLNKKIRDLNKGLNISFQDGESESFLLEYHGMGTRSWASLLTFKAYITWLSDNYEREGISPFHPILALEEPEAHLHPNAQRHLYSQLSAIKGQKIISSHSPYVAAQCRLEEIRHFYKTNDVPKVSQLDGVGLLPEDIRKIRRAVIHSRGELLFAKAVVLFEGETEEQALPIFAKSYWGRPAFELGINFVGVGGYRHYRPFINFCKTFNIPWFILSDGEKKTIEFVNKEIEELGYNLAAVEQNMVIIPDGNNYEKLLIAEGYREEIIAGIIELELNKFAAKDFKSAQYREEKLESIKQMRLEEIASYMKDNKTAISPIVAERLASHENKSKRYPSVIKKLFERMSAELKLKIDKAN